MTLDVRTRANLSGFANVKTYGVVLSVLIFNLALIGQLIMAMSNCRVRIGYGAPSRTPCPSRVTTFEKVVKGYVESPSENVIVPTLGASFDSLGEAYDCYNLYYLGKGFGIRYGKTRLNVERTKCMQEIILWMFGKLEQSACLVLVGALELRTDKIRCFAGEGQCGEHKVMSMRVSHVIMVLRTEDTGCYIAENREQHNHLFGTHGSEFECECG